MILSKNREEDEKFGNRVVTKNLIWLLSKKPKKSVYDAKLCAENTKFTHVQRNDLAIFRMAKQMRKENLDVCGEKCIKGDSLNICMDTESKKKAWKEHFDRLFNGMLKTFHQNLL